MHETMINDLEYLFGCDFQSEDFDPDGEEKHLEKAEELLRAYAWNDIRKACLPFLTRTVTPEDALNFCNLYLYYGWHEEYMPNPYRFAGYLYYRIDMDHYWDEASGTVDSIIIAMLKKQVCISLMKDPYYTPENDPLILNEVAKWRNGENRELE